MCKTPLTYSIFCNTLLFTLLFTDLDNSRNKLLFCRLTLWWGEINIIGQFFSGWFIGSNVSLFPQNTGKALSYQYGIILCFGRGEGGGGGFCKVNKSLTKHTINECHENKNVLKDHAINSHSPVPDSSGGCRKSDGGEGGGVVSGCRLLIKRGVAIVSAQKLQIWVWYLLFLDLLVGLSCLP